MMEVVFDTVENMVGKGENAGYQHFSPFPTMFSKVFYVKVVKTWDRLDRTTMSQDLVSPVFFLLCKD